MLTNGERDTGSEYAVISAAFETPEYRRVFCEELAAIFQVDAALINQAIE